MYLGIFISHPGKEPFSIEMISPCSSNVKHYMSFSLPFQKREKKTDLAFLFYPYQATEGLTLTTVNVDIFACLNFRRIMKMGNFVCIKTRV